MRDTIRDQQGRIIAFIDTTIHGDEVIFDKDNCRKGIYRKGQDITLDENNRMIGRGNQIMRLISN